MTIPKSRGKRFFMKFPFRGALYFVNKAPYLKRSLKYDNYDFRKVNITTISAQSTPMKKHLIVRSK